MSKKILHDTKGVIVIASAEFTYSKEEILNTLSDNDEKLVEAATNYAKKLSQEKIDVWEQIGNILITEQGYMVALFGDDLEKVEKQKNNETILRPITEHY